jgi:hypothetical protein
MTPIPCVRLDGMTRVVHSTLPTGAPSILVISGRRPLRRVWIWRRLQRGVSNARGRQF